MFVETNYFCQVKSWYRNIGTRRKFPSSSIFFTSIFWKRCRKPDFTFDPSYLETREIRFSSPRGSFKTCESLFRGSRDPSHFMVIRSDPAFRCRPDCRSRRLCEEETWLRCVLEILVFLSTCTGSFEFELEKDGVNVIFH